MIRFIMSFVAVLLCFLLSSCAPLDSVKRTTIQRTDPVTLEIVTTTVEEPMPSSGIAESANLKNYYTTIDKHEDACSARVTSQVNAIREEGKNIEYTRTEAVLMAVNKTLLIGQLRCDPLNLKQPTIMADVLNQNIVGVGNLLLTGWRLWGSDIGERSSSPNLTNTGSGNIFFNSSGNMNPAYNLTGGETGVSGITFNGNGYTPLLNDYSNTNDSRSYGLF